VQARTLTGPPEFWRAGRARSDRLSCSASP